MALTKVTAYDVAHSIRAHCRKRWIDAHIRSEIEMNKGTNSRIMYFRTSETGFGGGDKSFERYSRLATRNILSKRFKGISNDLILQAYNTARELERIASEIGRATWDGHYSLANGRKELAKRVPGFSQKTYKTLFTNEFVSSLR